MSLFVCFYCLIGLVGASRGLSLKVMDCRIVSSHGVSRRVTGFSFYHGLSDFFSHGESRRSRIIELSNFLHTECRGRSRVFITRLVLWTHWPTGGNYRIIELFLHTESRGGHELSNCYFQSHGESRKVTDFSSHWMLGVRRCGWRGGVGWVLVFVCDS